MKKLFAAIRKREINEVSKILNNRPELVNCVAGKTPKKDEGQSPLQVAIKTENNDIAKLLIERGADVRYMETGDNDEWRRPVLHFAVSAVTLNARFGIYVPKYSSQNTTGKDYWKTINKPTSTYLSCLEILKLIISKGAETNCSNNYGVNTLEVLCSHIVQDKIIEDLKALREESIKDIYPMLKLLKATDKSDFEKSSVRGNTIYYHYKDIIEQLIGNKPTHNKA
ncbi:MAG: hypothetical protein Wins2KO_31890 [Winogradskyella sp.]